MKLSYKSGGIALFQKDSETGEYTILLGKRKHNPEKEKWSIPGGGYEDYDKNLTETAKREFKEETELNLYVIKSSYRLSKAKFHEFSEVKQVPLNELKKYKLSFGVKNEVKTFKKLHK